MQGKKWLDQIDWILVGELIVVCIILFPILFISLHTLPVGDDFSNVVRFRSVMSEEHSYFITAVNEVVYYYKNISGYFLGGFLNFYISPFLRGGISALRITVFLINLFFYTSLHFLVAELLKFFYNIKNGKISLLVYILLLFAITNNYNNIETWAWYCVSVGYVLVAALMFWGIICFAKALRNDKWRYIAAASILGFLSSGASLNLTALNCGMYLIIGYFGIKIYHRKKTSMICFFSALSGAVMNVAAPGNYIRHGDYPYPVVGSIKTAAYLGWSRIQELLLYSPTILLLSICFILAVKFTRGQKRMTGKKLFIGLCVVILGVITVNFPVCLGYPVDFFPDRCIWVEDLTMYLGVFGWIIGLAEWINTRFGNIEVRKDTLLCISVSFVLYFCNLGVIRDLSDYPTVDMIKQIFSGEIAEYAAYWEDILNEIEMSEEKEVIIYRTEIRENNFLLTPCIGTEKEAHDNIMIAEYYGKDWVYIKTDGGM